MTVRLDVSEDEWRRPNEDMKPQRRKCSCARHTETKQDLSPEQDHSRSESARSTSWAECRNKKGSAPSRRRGFSLDIPFYRTCPVCAFIRTWVSTTVASPLR